MSYTVFEHASPAVRFVEGAFVKASAEATMSVTRAKSQPIGSALIRVTNTGWRDGDEVILLFAATPFTEQERSTNGAPLHNLIGFDRVHIRAGQTVSVHIPITAYSMSFAGAKAGTRVAAGGGWKFWTGSAEDGAKKESIIAELV